MGDIADSMLDGSFCEGCGVFIGEPVGFPQYCSTECADDRGADHSLVVTDEEDE